MPKKKESSEKLIEGMALSARYLEPMGYLTIWFSVLESKLDDAIGGFLKINSVANDILTSQFTSFRIKLDMLTTLVIELGKESDEKRNLLGILDSMRKVNASRNAHIHGIWYAPAKHDGYGESPPAFKLSTWAKGELKYTATFTNPQSISFIAWHAYLLSEVLPSAIKYCPRMKAQQRAWQSRHALRSQNNSTNQGRKRKAPSRRHAP